MLSYERRVLIRQELCKVDDVLTLNDLTEVLENYLRLFGVTGAYVVEWDFFDEEIYDDVFGMVVSSIQVRSSSGQLLDTYHIYKDIQYSNTTKLITTTLWNELFSILNCFIDELYDADVYNVSVCA